jgi:hypothetical protein
MRVRLRGMVSAVLVFALALPPAHAALYTWIDRSGLVNVSNLPPPDGVRVTNVTPAVPPEIAAGYEAARAAARRAEVEALAERVRQLEVEAEAASRLQSPPPVQYVPVPVPVAIPAPVPVLYQPEPVAQPAAGCDPSWLGCTDWWNPGFYPGSVVVVTVPQYRRGAGHGGHGGRFGPGRRPALPGHATAYTAFNPVNPVAPPMLTSFGPRRR